VTRQRAVAGGALVVAVAAVVAWALARQQNSLAVTLVRAVADGSAVVAFGLAAVPMLDIDRYRGELIRRATGPLTIASAIWLVAELLRLGVAAAQAAAVPVSRLGVHTAVDFALHTTPGRSGLFSAVAAALVCVTVVVTPRSSPTNVAVVGLAAAGVAARPLTGHLSESALGGVAVAVHTLAAALWCGALAAVVLTVEHRGQWARVLPRFSQLSLVCVAALLVGGVLAAVATLGSPSQLYATGYGRVLSAKVAVTVVLVLLAYRNRTMWLPAARTHRATAVVSRSRALFELAIMAVALTLAAALAVTG
jgi:putative copper resistance protein D